LAEFDVSVVAMDTSAAMLQEGRRHAAIFHRPYGMIVGSAFDIPLPDDAVDIVLCARLLHHFPDARPRLDILAELARVARYGVIISFFDATSYYGWRRRRRNMKKKSKRYSIPRGQCRREGEAVGLELLGFDTVLRYCTEITAATFLVH
jgi:ubiquinone/menaquinone biosynthesis C-methylase UbiE